MLLVLDRARAHRDVAEQVDEVLVVGRVEHLVGREEARLLGYAQVHVADGLDALEQVGRTLGVGVVEQALVAGAAGARLVGVDARDDDELVGDALGKLGEAGHEVEHGILTVGRAGANDEQAALAVAAGEDVGHLRVKGGLSGGKLGRDGHLLANLLGDGQVALEAHGHG